MEFAFVSCVFPCVVDSGYGKTFAGGGVFLPGFLGCFGVVGGCDVEVVFLFHPGFLPIRIMVSDQVQRVRSRDRFRIRMSTRACHYHFRLTQGRCKEESPPPVAILKNCATHHALYESFFPSERG
jgi:hypothetical protein